MNVFKAVKGHVITASSAAKVLPGQGGRRRLRAVRRHRPDRRRPPVEAGVFPGGGGPREATGAAVAVEAQGRILPSL